MGLDVSGHTILGIQVSREDFWSMTGEEFVCPFCSRKATADERFCSKDGRELQTRAIEKPTENFAKYAASINEEPDKLWERMQEAQFCSIWRCNAQQSCDDHIDRKFALGFRLGRTESHRSGGDGGVIATDFESCKLLVDRIKEMKVKLGLPGDPLVRIFTCVYLSY